MRSNSRMIRCAIGYSLALGITYNLQTSNNNNKRWIIKLGTNFKT